MKKLISLTLALLLVFSLATVASAAIDPDTGEWDGIYEPSQATTFTQIYKDYVSENSVIVSETLTFTSDAADTNPGTNNLTVDSCTVTALVHNGITINIPSYSKPGIYEYTISETAGASAGVTYTESTIGVIVLVEYDNTNKKLVIADVESFIKKVNGEKADTFSNTFKSGSFSVAKDVQGNMANENDEFEITVTLTAPQGKTIATPIKIAGQTVPATAWTDGVYTTTLTLSEADGATTFADIPVGVKVTVAEDTTESKMNGYTYKSGAVTDLEIEDTTDQQIVIVNEKTVGVDTGITLDSIPFILILAVCAGAVVLFVVKRRRSVDF